MPSEALSSRPSKYHDGSKIIRWRREERYSSGGVGARKRSFSVGADHCHVRLTKELGCVGGEEGIAAQATVLLQKKLTKSILTCRHLQSFDGLRLPFL